MEQLDLMNLMAAEDTNIESVKADAVTAPTPIDNKEKTTAKVEMQEEKLLEAKPITEAKEENSSQPDTDSETEAKEQIETSAANTTIKEDTNTKEPAETKPDKTKADKNKAKEVEIQKIKAEEDKEMAKFEAELAMAATIENPIKKAIEKLQNEAVSANYQILKDAFMPVIQNDELLARGILHPLKNFASCFNHLMNWAKEQAKKQCPNSTPTCYGADDKVIVSEMIHYFLDVEEKPKPKIKKCNTTELKAKYAPKKAEKPKETNQEMSLF